VLILQGNEGIGKTRFFLLMTPVPIWFQSLDKELTTKNKDILIQMLSSWIGEIGEVDRTFKANRSDVKNFMTLTKDSIRKPYAREPVTKARATSFCGTTNKAEFLNDDTGFRRWWVIQIQQKISMGYFVQPDNLHQFWSQCYAAYCSNPQCFRLTEEERRELEERNKEVMETLPAEDELRLRLDFEAPLETWRWIQPSALKNLPEYDVGRYTTQELGAAIRAIMRDVPGIQRKRNKKGTAYFIPPSISNTDRYRNRLQGGSGLQ
jgi:putative DNA primase/helicase